MRGWRRSEFLTALRRKKGIEMKMSTYDKFGLVVMGVAIVGFGGWVANIVKLIGMDWTGVTGLLVARAIGIPFAPLGAVMGFI